MLPTAELDAGKGTDAATDQVDEQCRAATNEQLSHPRSQAAAAVEDTDHRPDGEQGEARQDDHGITTTTAHAANAPRLDSAAPRPATRETGWPHRYASLLRRRDL